MFNEYKMGRTPNPDVLCNREIKFEAFLKSALELGAQYVATGHYCRKEGFINSAGEEIYRLKAGVDLKKDQSYFLCQLSQEQLSKSLFPIGHLTKNEVRRVAKNAKLPSADRKDSQGICFVGKIDLPLFLQQKLEVKEGDVVEIFPSFYKEKRLESKDLEQLAKPYNYQLSDGKPIGKHNGAHFFTIGQRKGLGIGGHQNPLFVISTDVINNIIYVGEGQEHPGLFRSALHMDIAESHWIRPDLKLKIGEEIEVMVRIRYRQPLQSAKLILIGNGLYLLFKEPQRGITPGQFAAWYIDDELIGSGVIS